MLSDVHKSNSSLVPSGRYTQSVGTGLAADDMFKNYDEGVNEYLHTLLNPWGRLMVAIPDDDCTPYHLKRIYSKSERSGLADVTYLWMPFSKNSILLECVPGTHSVLGTPALGFNSVIPLAEDTTGSYRGQRVVSGGLRVKSSTLPSGAFAIQGQMTAAVLHNLPNVRNFDATQLTPYNSTDAIVSASVMDGVVGLAFPEGDQKFKNRSTLSSGAYDDGYCDQFRQTGVDGNGWTFTNFLALGAQNIFSTRSTSELIPGDLRGKFKVTIDLRADYATTDPIYTANLDIYTLNAACVPTITQTFQLCPNGNEVHDTVTFYSDYFIDSMELNVTVATAAVGAATYVIGSILIENCDSYSRGENTPFYVITLENFDPAANLSVDGVLNYEMVPNAELSRDIETKSERVDNINDFFIAREFMRHDPIVRPLFLGTDYHDFKLALSEFAERRHLIGRAAGLWSTLKKGWSWLKSKPWFRRIASTIIGSVNPVAGRVVDYGMRRVGFAEEKKVGYCSDSPKQLSEFVTYENKNFCKSDKLSKYRDHKGIDYIFHPPLMSIKKANQISKDLPPQNIMRTKYGRHLRIQLCPTLVIYDIDDNLSEIVKDPTLGSAKCRCGKGPHPMTSDVETLLKVGLCLEEHLDPRFPNPYPQRVNPVTIARRMAQQLLQNNLDDDSPFFEYFNDPRYSVATIARVIDVPRVSLPNYEVWWNGDMHYFDTRASVNEGYYYLKEFHERIKNYIKVDCWIVKYLGETIYPPHLDPFEILMVTYPVNIQYSQWLHNIDTYYSRLEEQHPIDNVVDYSRLHIGLDLERFPGPKEYLSFSPIGMAMVEPVGLCMDSPGPFDDVYDTQEETPYFDPSGLNPFDTFEEDPEMEEEAKLISDLDQLREQTTDFPESPTEVVLDSVVPISEIMEYVAFDSNRSIFSDFTPQPQGKFHLSFFPYVAGNRSAIGAIILSGKPIGFQLNGNPLKYHKVVESRTMYMSETLMLNNDQGEAARQQIFLAFKYSKYDNFYITAIPFDFPDIPAIPVNYFGETSLGLAALCVAIGIGSRVVVSGKLDELTPSGFKIGKVSGAAIKYSALNKMKSAGYVVCANFKDAVQNDIKFVDPVNRYRFVGIPNALGYNVYCESDLIAITALIDVNEKRGKLSTRTKARLERRRVVGEEKFLSASPEELTPQMLELKDILKELPDSLPLKMNSRRTLIESAAGSQAALKKVPNTLKMVKDFMKSNPVVVARLINGTYETKNKSLITRWSFRGKEVSPQEVIKLSERFDPTVKNLVVEYEPDLVEGNDIPRSVFNKINQQLMIHSSRKGKKTIVAQPVSEILF